MIHTSPALKQQAALRLLYWRQGGTSYTTELYGLMSKADNRNFELLAKVYHFEAAAFLAWRSSKSEMDYFRAEGVWEEKTV